MNLILFLQLAWSTFKTDRAVQAGTGASVTSLWGAHNMTTISAVQTWIALFAAFFGGLSALATFVYVCIKIRRLLKNPVAKE